MKEASNFARKHCLIVVLFIFKYQRQNISDSNTALITADSCQALLRSIEFQSIQYDSLSLSPETPDFIGPAVCPANSPDLNRVDIEIGEAAVHVYRSRIRDVNQSVELNLYYTVLLRETESC